MNNLLKKVILGTVQFGLPYGINNSKGMPEKGEAFEILNKALAGGIETLDTADAYGISTELIGEYHSLSEKKFNVNTKFRLNETQISLQQQLKNSLSLLNLHSVNVYFFHSFDDFFQNKNVLSQLNDFKESGLIQKIGLSVYDNNEFEIAIHQPHIDVIQIPYNALDNNTQKGHLLLKAKERGKSIQARSVFLQGLFFINPDTLPLKLTPLYPYLTEFRKHALHYQLTIEAACLAYVFSNPLIDEVILGVDSLEHLQTNITQLNSINQNLDYTNFDSIVVREQELLFPKNW